ncbi:MAG: aldehyde dehydrogenase family protein [Planctomycetes bacterium]|nr:aldehyde dehydrogenase family protein [Planctomycetota bacterium]
MSTNSTNSSTPALDFGQKWQLDAAPETTPVQIADEYGLFINGDFRAALSGQTMVTINPATEEALAQFAVAGLADVDAAVAAARKALPAWQQLPAVERGKYLYRLARRLQERAREFAILETMDGGKPIKESRDVDIPEAAKHFFYHAGWADKLDYAFPNRQVEPVGVCAQIIPWNFPLLMAAWKIAPALACGNTVVLKPAETTPLTALRLAEVLQEIELPAGVVNIVTGGGETGAALANHPDVNKVAFTGSTEVGKTLAAAAAGTGKKLTLELGGKSPQIIMEDACLDQAIEGVIQGIYFNQGHVCCAGSRLLVQESILAEVMQRLELRMKTLRVGNPLDKNTDVGAINSAAQLQIIQDYIRVGQEEGAELCTPTQGELPEVGFWQAPCFFKGVQPVHTIAREEIFGPVLSVLSFRTPEEALQRANQSPYGLAAGIWTDKGSKMFSLASRIKAGVVWCNSYNRFDAASPFGGFKQSGFGREGGRHGLRAYLNLKS